MSGGARGKEEQAPPSQPWSAGSAGGSSSYLTLSTPWKGYSMFCLGLLLLGIMTSSSKQGENYVLDGLHREKPSY